MSIVIESGERGGFLENTIRISLPKGPPLGFGEICVDFWDFRRGGPEVVFLLLLVLYRTKSALRFKRFKSTDVK